MKTITLINKQYPVIMTMGAMLEFKQLTGMELADLEQNDWANLNLYFYCLVKSSCRREKVDFPFENPMEFADALDLQEFTRLSKSMNEGKEDPAPDKAKKK